MFELKPIALGLFLASALGGCASLQMSQQQSQSVPPNLVVSQAGPNAPALYRLGHVYQSQLRYKDAINAYQSALRKDPEYAEAHNALGVVHATLGDHVSAVTEFRTALKLSPQTAHFHNNLGYAYALRGFDAEALEAFERAEPLDPANPKILANLRGTREKMARKQLTAEYKAAALLQSASATTQSLRFEPQVVANDLGAMRLIEINPNVYELRAPQPIAANFGVVAGLPISAGLATGEAAAEKTAAESLRNISIEVSNGNGITGMAKRVARFFKSQGITTARLTNQKPFDRPVTTIEYRDGYRDHARALNSKLPQAGTLAQVNDLRQGIAVRLVLGRDLSHHLTAFDADATFASSKPTR